MKGQFISFEGIDGAGKSTHVAGAVDYLRSQGIEVIVSREPGGTEMAEKLRELLLHTPMDATTELLLMFAARADHLYRLIRPAIERGAWVVCDRFTDSTLAYQGGGRKLDRQLIRQLADTVHEDCWPDRTYYFDLDPVTAQARRQANRKADRFEAEQAAFFDRVRGVYQQLARDNPARIMTLNAAAPVVQVRARLLEDLTTQVARFG